MFYSQGHLKQPYYYRTGVFQPNKRYIVLAVASPFIFHNYKIIYNISFFHNMLYNIHVYIKSEDACNKRLDVFLRNPRGLGRQVIIDVEVAVTEVDGQAMRRLSDSCRFVMIRKWLNMVALQSKTI